MRKMKRNGERCTELAEREDQERRERQERERQAKGQACGPVERQVEEMYIDDYYEFNDDY
jgi:hypothetical protein